MVRFVLNVAEMAGTPPNKDGETFAEIYDRQSFTVAQSDSYWYTVEMLTRKGFLIVTDHDDPNDFNEMQLWGPSWDGHDLLDQLKAQESA